MAISVSLGSVFDWFARQKRSYSRESTNVTGMREAIALQAPIPCGSCGRGMQIGERQGSGGVVLQAEQAVPDDFRNGSTDLERHSLELPR